MVCGVSSCLSPRRRSLAGGDTQTLHGAKQDAIKLTHGGHTQFTDRSVNMAVTHSSQIVPLKSSKLGRFHAGHLTALAVSSKTSGQPLLQLQLRHVHGTQPKLTWNKNL